MHEPCLHMSQDFTYMLPMVGFTRDMLYADRVSATRKCTTIAEQRLWGQLHHKKPQIVAER